MSGSHVPIRDHTAWNFVKFLFFVGKHICFGKSGSEVTVAPISACNVMCQIISDSHAGWTITRNQGFASAMNLVLQRLCCLLPRNRWLRYETLTAFKPDGTCCEALLHTWRSDRPPPTSKYTIEVQFPNYYHYPPSDALQRLLWVVLCKWPNAPSFLRPTTGTCWSCALRPPSRLFNVHRNFPLFIRLLAFIFAPRRQHCTSTILHRSQFGQILGQWSETLILRLQIWALSFLEIDRQIVPIFAPVLNFYTLRDPFHTQFFTHVAKVDSIRR